ncbi:MAG: YIP1 family protein [Chloroflexota bacterium]|nr:YIP1 family protein [Chloroflexota bacterium]
MSYNYTEGGPTAPIGGAPDPAIGQAGLMDVVNSWITSVTKPAIPTYAAEVPRATQNRLIMSVGIVTVVAAVAGLLGGLFHGGAVTGLFGGLIGTPIGFFLGAGLFYLCGKLMKGTAGFMEFAWVWSTIWAPATIISDVVGLIPVLGGWIPVLGGLLSLLAGLVWLAVFVYAMYLYYLVNQAVQRLDSSNALIATLIPVAVIVVLGIVGIVLGAGAALLATGAISR